MTSNLGSQYAFEKEGREEKYMAEVKRYFKPEFVNRIDEIIVFNALNEEMLAKIAHKFMNELSERLAHCYTGCGSGIRRTSDEALHPAQHRNADCEKDHRRRCRQGGYDRGRCRQR